MSTRSALFSTGAALGAATILALGCSNEVTQGTGGAHSTTTASGTTATATHATSVGSTTNGTVVSSSSGGSACDMACAKAAGCGFDFCANFALDCTNALQACAADCVNNASCPAILSLQMPQSADPSLVGCLFACQQSGTTSSSTGGGNMCTSCLGMHQGCIPQGCLASPVCQAWGMCAIACGNQGPSCYAACDAANPNAASFYDQFYQCACTNCDTQCGMQIDACSHGTTTTTASTGTGN